MAVGPLQTAASVAASFGASLGVNSAHPDVRTNSQVACPIG